MEKLQTSCALFLDLLPRNHFGRRRKRMAKKHRIRSEYGKASGEIDTQKGIYEWSLYGALGVGCYSEFCHTRVLKSYVRKLGLRRRSRHRRATPCYLIFVFIYDFLRWTSSIVWHSHLPHFLLLFLCSFRFECHLVGHCLRCFSGKRGERITRKKWKSGV